jgi:hypothetical protein
MGIIRHYSKFIYYKYKEKQNLNRFNYNDNFIDKMHNKLTGFERR